MKKNTKLNNIFQSSSSNSNYSNYVREKQIKAKTSKCKQKSLDNGQNQINFKNNVNQIIIMLVNYKEPY